MSVLSHANATEDLLATDDRKTTPHAVAPGDRLALRVAFTLPSSAYATVVLRQLTQQSFSTTRHSELTAAAAAAGGGTKASA